MLEIVAMVVALALLVLAFQREKKEKPKEGSILHSQLEDVIL